MASTQIAIEEPCTPPQVCKSLKCPGAPERRPYFRQFGVIHEPITPSPVQKPIECPGAPERRPYFCQFGVIHE
jgi:hypothetical protein